MLASLATLTLSGPRVCSAFPLDPYTCYVVCRNVMPMYVCTFIQTSFVYIHTHTHTYINMFTCTYTSIHIHIHVHIHIHTDRQTYIHKCACNMYMRDISTCSSVPVVAAQPCSSIQAAGFTAVVDLGSVVGFSKSLQSLRSLQEICEFQENCA